MIVGGGPYADSLHRLAAECGVERDVVFTGGVPNAELPGHHAMADVFAMPCRNPWRRLDVEGLGIVFFEASATGVAVVAGDSGERRRPCSTARPAGGRRPPHSQIVDAVSGLLADPAAARRRVGPGASGSGATGTGTATPHGWVNS